MTEWTPPESVLSWAQLNRSQLTGDLQRKFRDQASTIERENAAKGIGPGSGGVQTRIFDFAGQILTEEGTRFGLKLLDLVSLSGVTPDGAGEWVLDYLDETIRTISAAFEQLHPLTGNEPFQRAFVERLERARGSVRTALTLELGERKVRQEAAVVPVPVPLEIDEPPEFKIKRWEELLALVKLGHELASRRWDRTDEKATRYATFLGVVLATSAVGFSEVAKIVGRRWDALDVVFLLAYGGVALCGVISFVCFLWALRPQNAVEPPLGQELLAHVAENNYVDVLYSMSVRFVESTQALSSGTASKMRVAGRGFLWLRVALVCAIISSVAYVAIKARQEMSNGIPSASIPAPAKSPALPSPTSPNPNVSAPAGEVIQKGFEGPPPPPRPKPSKK